MRWFSVCIIVIIIPGHKVVFLLILWWKYWWKKIASQVRRERHRLVLLLNVNTVRISRFLLLHLLLKFSLLLHCLHPILLPWRRLLLVVSIVRQHILQWCLVLKAASELKHVVQHVLWFLLHRHPILDVREKLLLAW